MASHTLLSLLLSTTLLLPILANAKTPVAPGPTPAPLNLTGILDKGSQYTTLLRLFKETQVGEQLSSQLNNSFDGMTIFAPTDNAFNKLKAGTLNSLTAQEQVQLVEYHVVPRFYSLTTFETTSNPIRTQASGGGGVYTVNVTSTTSQVNVSTGVNEAPISNTLYSEFPLAVYSVDSVLLPEEMFGVKPPAPAPAPAADTKPKKPKKGNAASDVAAEPAAADADSTKSVAASLKGSVGWRALVGVGLMGIVNFIA